MYVKNDLNLIDNKYSEEELEENIIFFSEVSWHILSAYQKLSELFIEKHSDKLDWDLISQYQKLSEEFIKKHINKISIPSLMENYHISKKIKEEIKTLKEII